MSDLPVNEGNNPMIADMGKKTGPFLFRCPQRLRLLASQNRNEIGKKSARDILQA